MAVSRGEFQGIGQEIQKNLLHPLFIGHTLVRPRLKGRALSHDGAKDLCLALVDQPDVDVDVFLVGRVLLDLHYIFDGPSYVESTDVFAKLS